MPWRLLLSPPSDGPTNMALDEALMARARRDGETILRVYSWSVPTLSLGRHQRAADVYDLGALERAGVGVVRRPTGGRALLHHREITYSVAAPLRGNSLAAEYGGINRLLVRALGALGVPVQVAAAGGQAAVPGPTPCFAEPAAGELVMGGRKLVGSAQWRDDGALLQHGSILVDDDQHRLGAFMREPAGVFPAAATLRGTLGRRPSPHEVAAALFTAVRENEDADASTLELDAGTLESASRLEHRHRDAAWIWRR